MTTSETAQPIVEKEDFRISYRQDRFLAWPFLGRAYCFDGTELVVNFFSAPCRYERLVDIRHTTVLENSTVITARSLDGGQTWPDDQQTELFDLRSTYSELEAGRRLDVDMRQPDSILFSYSAYNWGRKGGLLVSAMRRDTLSRPGTHLGDAADLDRSARYLRDEDL